MVHCAALRNMAGFLEALLLEIKEVVSLRRRRLLFWAATMVIMLLATSSPAMAQDFEVLGEIDGEPVVFEFECVEEDDDLDGISSEDFWDGIDNDLDGFVDEDDAECDDWVLEDIEAL